MSNTDTDTDTDTETETETDELPTGTVLRGDSLEMLANGVFPDESVHAIVTDPPYGLSFMGESWDEFEPKEYQAWCEEWAASAFRVLKPGGHLIAFSGNRTHHRLFSGVEDAGFTVRDTLIWLYGNGMPKGARVSRWMDDADAEAWDGWRTDLKPAAEFAVLAQKPPSEDAFYRNVLEHGTGALNIDGCRVPIGDDGERGNWPGREQGADDADLYGEGKVGGEAEHDDGRYPANVTLDPFAARLLDAEAGEAGGGFGRRGEGGRVYGGGEGFTPTGTDADDGKSVVGYGDDGGPSRFYYCSKASESERTHDGTVENSHPTVKPLDLMRWLVRLVTAEGQTVLDPFAGSGTTALAAEAEGREWVAVELDSGYASIARERVAAFDPADAEETGDTDEAHMGW